LNKSWLKELRPGKDSSCGKTLKLNLIFLGLLRFRLLLSEKEYKVSWKIDNSDSVTDISSYVRECPYTTQLYFNLIVGLNKASG